MVFSVFIIGLALILLKRYNLLTGLFAGAIWSTVNILLTIQILSGIAEKRLRSRMAALLLIKFPLLYGVGAWMLFSRIFLLIGLGIGLFLIFPALGMAYLWNRQDMARHSLN